MFGPDADVFLIADELKKCALDKVSVVRHAAAEALEALKMSGYIEVDVAATLAETIQRKLLRERSTVAKALPKLMTLPQN